MSLYCLKHKVFAYRNHKCSPLSLVPITHECRTIADKMYPLGIEILSAAHFTSPVTGSYTEHYINLCIELRKDYPIIILGDVPSSWKIYTETVTEDHTPLQVIGYNERFHCTGVLTVDERVQEIIKGFEDYLDTRDVKSMRAMMKLAGYEVGW